MKRVFTFGKYKGETIKQVLLTHIGYIVWCFENIENFFLNEDEQRLYDAIAIASKRDNIKYIFPSSSMYKYIKDTKSFDELKSPIIFCDGFVAIEGKYKNTRLFHYIRDSITAGVSFSSIEDNAAHLNELNKSFWKNFSIFEDIYTNNENEFELSNFIDKVFEPKY